MSQFEWFVLYSFCVFGMGFFGALYFVETVQRERDK